VSGAGPHPRWVRRDKAPLGFQVLSPDQGRNLALLASRAYMRDLLSSRWSFYVRPRAVSPSRP